MTPPIPEDDNGNKNRTDTVVGESTTADTTTEDDQAQILAEWEEEFKGLEEVLATTLTEEEEINTETKEATTNAVLDTVAVPSSPAASSTNKEDPNDDEGEGNALGEPTSIEISEMTDGGEGKTPIVPENGESSITSTTAGDDKPSETLSLKPKPTAAITLIPFSAQTLAQEAAEAVETNTLAHEDGHPSSAATTAEQQQRRRRDEQRRLSVTTDRKEILLLKARKSRNEWVGRIPTPYNSKDASMLKAKSSMDDGSEHVWDQEERLASLKGMYATKRIPTALPILSHLYGLDSGDSTPSQVADRIQATLGQNLQHGRNTDSLTFILDERVVPTADETVQDELALNKDDPYLRDYHTFWTQLQDPQSAMLVQGMRNFCSKIRNATQKDELIAKLQSYVKGAFQTLQSHPLWKKKGHNKQHNHQHTRGGGGGGMDSDESVRRALESFVYGQCYSHIESVLWTNLAQQREDEWMERLNALQFVTPQHLEISCLMQSETNGVGPLKDLLQGPIDALNSVRLYYSPYDKLQRILALYHGVNAALSAALNRDRGDGTNSGDNNKKPKKLPSADDVLPAIILAVLLAKPQRLHMDLELVEDFSPPEYLRGEAGYAFTNLYGAVHFLLDLNLDEPKTLSISPDEFKKGLEECRAKAEERIQRNPLLSTMADSTATIEDGASTLPANIPPIEVRLARLRGEKVDLDWAARYTQQMQLIGTDQAEDEHDHDCSKSDDLLAGLPPGFTRNYSFLTSRPEDIKLSDLPKLLSEYRALVHTTEKLLGERAEKARAERKAKLTTSQNELFARVGKVDPSLLPKAKTKK